jgi:hypothetical protein
VKRWALLLVQRQVWAPQGFENRNLAIVRKPSLGGRQQQDTITSLETARRQHNTVLDLYGDGDVTDVMMPGGMG